MKPRTLGDAFSYTLILVMLLIMIIALSFGVQNGLTEPAEVTEKHQVDLNATGFSVIQGGTVGDGCIEDSEQFYDPEDNVVLEKPVDYTTVSYAACKWNVTDFHNNENKEFTIGLAYQHHAPDQDGSYVMERIAVVADVLASWVFPLTLLIALMMLVAYLAWSLKSGNRGR